MADKNSFILYLEYADILRDTTDAQFGRLMRHLFVHAAGGDANPEPDIAIAYRFIVNQMDRDSEKYDEKIEGRRKAGAVGGKKRAENAKMAPNFEENGSDSQANQANQANATFASDFQANASKVKQTQANPSKVKQSQASSSKSKQKQANQADNVNDNDNDNENENVNVSVTVTDTVNDNVQGAQSALPVEKSVEKSVESQKENFDCFFGENEKRAKANGIPPFWEVQRFCTENHPNVNAEDFYNYYKSQGWTCNGQPIKNWQSLLSAWAKHQRQEQKPSYDIDEFLRLALNRPINE